MGEAEARGRRVPEREVNSVVAPSPPEITLSSLSDAVVEFRQYVNRRKGEEATWKRLREEAQQELASCKEEEELLQKVSTLLQVAGEYAREQARRQLELIVSQALQYVFGNQISFEVEMGISKGRPEGEFYVNSRYGDVQIRTRPQDARGGGVVDVVSLALRIAFAELAHVDGPIFLDEPGKHVSAEYSPHVAGFLKEMSEAFSRQIVLITHDQHLAEVADKSFRVSLRDGVSHLVVVNGESTASHLIEDEPS